MTNQPRCDPDTEACAEEKVQFQVQFSLSDLQRDWPTHDFIVTHASPHTGAQNKILLRLPPILIFTPENKPFTPFTIQKWNTDVRHGATRRFWIRDII